MRNTHTGRLPVLDLCLVLHFQKLPHREHVEPAHRLVVILNALVLGVFFSCWFFMALGTQIKAASHCDALKEKSEMKLNSS